MKKSYLLTLALLTSTSSFAKEEHREHGAHEHGHAQLSVVTEKNDMILALDTPSMNLFGFEHEPRNDEQKATVIKAVKSLEDFSSLVILDSGAKCTVASTKINLPSDDHDEHDHKDEHKHDEHGHDDHKEHAEHKDEHDEHKHDEHAHDEHKEHAEHKDEHDEHKHDEHGHDEHEEEVHSDVDLEVAIKCENASELTKLDLTPLFKRFPLFEELDTQAIINGKQSAAELTKDSPVFTF